MTDDTRDTARELLERVKRESADPEDVEALVEMLRADDDGVQRMAINGLRTVAGRQPGLLADLDAGDLDAIRALCSHDDPSARGGAVALLESIWSPDLIPAGEVLSTVRPLLTDDAALVRGNAVQMLQTVAAVDSEAITSVVDDVVALLDLTGDYRKAAVSVVARAATEDPDSVRGHLDRLLELFESDLVGPDAPALGEMSDRRTQKLQEAIRNTYGESFQDHRYVRQMSGHAIVEVAADDPDAVLPFVEELVTQLGDFDPEVRHVVADTFVALGGDRPGVVAEHAGDLARLVEPDEAEFVVGSALKALAAAVGTDEAVVADAVRGDVEVLHANLDDEDPTTRGAAATLLAVLAEEDPSVVDPVADRLRELSEDDPEYVRAAAADALRSAE